MQLIQFFSIILLEEQKGQRHRYKIICFVTGICVPASCVRCSPDGHVDFGAVRKISLRK